MSSNTSDSASILWFIRLSTTSRSSSSTTARRTAAWRLRRSTGSGFPRCPSSVKRTRGFQPRNAGMKLACGEYIGLDSDDWACLDDVSVAARPRHARQRRSGDCRRESLLARPRPCRGLLRPPAMGGAPARCKNEPFCIHDEPRALGLEPAAWKRLYKRSFLEAVGFQFPVGLVFEDIPAHFHLLLSAQRISLLDKPVCFYRMDRPGNMTARRDRVALQMLDIFALRRKCSARPTPTHACGPSTSAFRRASALGYSTRFPRKCDRSSSAVGRPSSDRSPPKHSPRTIGNSTNWASVSPCYAFARAGAGGLQTSRVRKLHWQ